MNLPIAIVDSRAPLAVLEYLQRQFTVFSFSSVGITYEAIRCHPDVFMFFSDSSVIVAPNSPQNFVQFLTEHAIPFSFGNLPVGDCLESSTLYNCVQTDSHFFHKKGFTDSVILQEQSEKKFISLPQAYTRCSMFALTDDCIITSDKGIETVLLSHGFSCLYVNPQQILLPPYSHGFFGGCVGMFNSTLYIMGRLSYLPQSQEILQLCKSLQIRIVELYDGPLYDGGGIFFLESYK